MDIINQIIEQKDREEKAASIGDLSFDRTSLLTGGAPPKRKTSEYLESATGWVYACVAAISDEVAMTNLRLFKMNPKTGDTTEIITHPILDVLFRANDFTTKFDLFWLTQQYLDLSGEAPWFVSYGPNKTPQSLLLLRPDKFTPVPDASKKNIIGGYKYTVDFNKTIILAPEEVVFLRYPDPTKPFRGKGTLQAVARTADIEEFSEEYNRKFFYNSATPDAVLQTEKSLTKKQRNDIETALKKKYRGLDNAHKTMVLEAGLEWKMMGITQRDMEFMEQMRFSRDKILGIFRVPRTVLGITDDVNRANAEATDLVFAKRCIKPRMQRMLEQLNEFFVPLFPGAENLFLDFDDPVPENTELKLKEHETALRSGYKTINEVRESENLEPVGPEGDVIYVQPGMTPLGESGADADQDPEEDMPQKDFESQGVMKKALLARSGAIFRRKQAVKKIKRMIIDQVAEKLTPIIKSQLVKNQDRTENEMKKESDEQAQKELERKQKFQFTQIEIETAKEKAVLTAVLKTFDRQKKQVVSQIKGTASIRKAFDDVGLDPEKEANVMVRIFKPLLGDLIKDQSKQAFGFIGINDQLNLDNPSVRNYLLKRIVKFSKNMTKLSNKKIARALAEGVQEGESIAQLKKRIGNVFDDMKGYRSERIARSEVSRATNFANEQSYKDSGVVVEKEWLTFFDERSCEFCPLMNGTRKKLGGKYFSKGDAMTGSKGGTLPFGFDNIEGPPLHPNCRCTLVPVI